MKLFSLILSVVVFFAALYYFTLKIGYVVTFDDTIYVTLLVILMAICICGVLINLEFLRKKNAKRLIFFVSNKFSDSPKKKPL